MNNRAARSEKYQLPPSLLGVADDVLVAHRHTHAHPNAGRTDGSTIPEHPTDGRPHTHPLAGVAGRLLEPPHVHPISKWSNSHYHPHTGDGAYPENVSLVGGETDKSNMVERIADLLETRRLDDPDILSAEGWRTIVKPVTRPFIKRVAAAASLGPGGYPAGTPAKVRKAWFDRWDSKFGGTQLRVAVGHADGRGDFEGKLVWGASRWGSAKAASASEQRLRVLDAPGITLRQIDGINFGGTDVVLFKSLSPAELRLYDDDSLIEEIASDLRLLRAQLPAADSDPGDLPDATNPAYKDQTRAAAKAAIMVVLDRAGAASREALLAEVKQRIGDLADDRIECGFEAHSPRHPEWQDQVDWALQELRQEGRIYNYERGVWSLRPSLPDRKDKLLPDDIPAGVIDAWQRKAIVVTGSEGGLEEIAALLETREMTDPQILTARGWRDLIRPITRPFLDEVARKLPFPSTRYAAGNVGRERSTFDRQFAKLEGGIEAFVAVGHADPGGSELRGSLAWGLASWGSKDSAAGALRRLKGVWAPGFSLGTLGGQESFGGTTVVLQKTLSPREIRERALNELTDLISTDLVNLAELIAADGESARIASAVPDERQETVAANSQQIKRGAPPSTPLEDTGEYLNQWVETLPFPLASILRAWLATQSDDFHARYVCLEHFFAATAEFLGIILLSGFATRPEEFHQHMLAIKDDMRKSRLSFDRATFGTWKGVVDYFGKKTRQRLAVANERITCADMFVDPSLKFAEMLGRKEVAQILSTTNKMRNDWSGHGGIVGPDQARLRNEALLGEVTKLRQAFQDGWSEVQLVRPLLTRKRGDIFENEVAVLTGSNSAFLKGRRRLALPLDVDRLHFVGTTGGVLELLPLIRMGPVPDSETSAIYFFNRVERNGMRFVSYHYLDQPEVTNPDADAMEAIAFLLGD